MMNTEDACSLCTVIQSTAKLVVQGWLRLNASTQASLWIQAHKRTFNAAWILDV